MEFLKSTIILLRNRLWTKYLYYLHRLKAVSLSGYGWIRSRKEGKWVLTHAKKVWKYAQSCNFEGDFNLCAQ